MASALLKNHTTQCRFTRYKRRTRNNYIRALSICTIIAKTFYRALPNKATRIPYASLSVKTFDQNQNMKNILNQAMSIIYRF